MLPSQCVRYVTQVWLNAKVGKYVETVWMCAHAVFGLYSREPEECSLFIFIQMKFEPTASASHCIKRFFFENGSNSDIQAKKKYTSTKEPL